MEIISFYCGLAYVVMGVVLLTKPWRESELELASHIWLLSVFGLCRGLVEWLRLDLFASYVPISVEMVSNVLSVAAFMALGEFSGRLMFTTIRHEGSRSREEIELRQKVGSWTLVMVALVIAAAFYAVKQLGGSDDQALRFLVVLPFSLHFSYVMLRYTRYAESHQLLTDPLKQLFFVVAAGFFLQAVVAAAISYPANEMFWMFELRGGWESTAHFLRVVVTTMVALGIVGAAQIIDAERRYKLEEAVAELTHYQGKLEQLVQQRTQQIESAIKLARLGTWRMDLRSGEVYNSPEWLQMLGLQQDDELDYERMKQLIHPDDLSRVEAAMSQLVADGGTVDMEFRVLPATGGERILHVYNEVSCDERGAPLCVLGTAEDVTAARRAQREIQLREEMFRGAFDHAAVAMALTDTQGRFQRVNRAMCELTGYSEDELLQMSWSNLTHPDDLLASRAAFEGLHRDRLDSHSLEKRYVRKDGGVIWVSSNVAVLNDLSGRPMSFIGQVVDITESRELSQQLGHQARHDALTGLVNRREFESRLQHMLAATRKRGTEHALAYIDLDQFKVVNDTCGHAAGDELLRQLAPLLQAEVRQRDTVARLGGDEFGLLLEHCDLRQAQRVTDAIRRAVMNYRFVWGDKSFSIGASIGLVPINQYMVDADEVLRRADAACFTAKNLGRNCVHVYHPGGESVAPKHSETAWAAAIPQAIEQDRFSLHYQRLNPIAFVGDGLYYEVLLRMQAEEGGLIMPGAFMPAAERYGLAVDVDRYVVEHVVEWLNANRSHLDALGMCSLNLNGASLGNDRFLRDLDSRLRAVPAVAEKLCFEIRETAVTANMSGAQNFIVKLKDRGVRFALDDFGTGLSSIAHFRRLPVDMVKIDATFVNDIAEDSVAHTLVASINKVAHQLDIVTVAKCIEREPVLATLRELGVDFVQGHIVEQPRSLAELSDTDVSTFLSD